MFVAEGLIYLELQKTGGTHIRRLLEEFTAGRPVGKHNRLLSMKPDDFIIGSIRNPWDWYVSLWAYGVSGRGAVRERCVNGIDFNYYHRLLPKAMGKNWLSPRELAISLFHDAIKPVSKWRHTYNDSSDPELFRNWIRLLLDNRRRFDIGEGYGFSPLSRCAGLLTYRYFRLFTLGDHIFRDSRLASYSCIADFDGELNISRGMIRTESLEEDFIQLLEQAGHALSEDQRAVICNRRTKKTNVSERKSAAWYYDEETIALVAERERYLIEKYNYKAPE